MEKAFEELQIKDDFMFSVIIEKSEVLQTFFRTGTWC